MYTRKRDVRVVGIFFLLFLIYSLQGWAQERGLTITPTGSSQSITEGTDYTYESGLLTVKTSTPVTITSGGKETSDHIAIEDETKATVTINDVYINYGSTIFDIKGNASVTLKLMGINSFSLSDWDGCLICCESNSGKTASLTVEGTGTLIAQKTVEGPDGYDASIGNRDNKDAGIITINSGVIIIENRKRYYNAAAIGGNNGTITINGGIIMVNNMIREAISGSTIAISGGILNCESKIYGTTTITGNPFIIAREIDKTNQSSWSGVIFEEDNGKVYGSPTLPDETLTIPSGKTLTIEDGKTLTIGSNTTLLNEGTIVNNGTIANSGVIGVKGTLTNNTTSNTKGTLYSLAGANLTGTEPLTATDDGVLFSFDGNAGSETASNLPPAQVKVKNTGYPVKPTETPVRAGYTFSGWSESSTGSLISDGNWSSITSTTDKKLYALWKYNTKLAFNESSYSYTYGGTVPTVTATVNGAPSGAAPTGSISYSYYSDAECKNSISTPTAVGTYYVKATYPGDDNNMKAETSSAVTYTIETKELTVTGTITKVYDGETTVDLAGLGLNGVVSGDESNVSLNKSDYSLTYASKEVGTSINLTPTGTLSLSGDKSGNYTLAQPSGLTGAITAKELTVTPTASQSVYKDEIPAYSVSGMVGLEKAAFSGALGVNAESPKKVTKGNLTLIDDNESGFKAANYTWELSSADVEITVLDKTMKDGIIEASSLTTDWSKKKVVLKAPTGFQIAAVSPLRSTVLDWKDRIEIEKEGNYDFECQLKRTAGTMPAQTVFIPIKLDNTDPVVSIAINHLIVTVTLSDDMSGLASCTYVWNNGGDKTEPLITGNKTHSFTLTAPSAGSYPLKIVLTDQAGNETTYNETVTLTNPTTPVDPPVGPSEPSETYTVTLPAVEGAATDPAAGNYEVTSWSDFGFLLTLDAAYNQSAPIVTTDRGETIEPRAGDGKYIIKQVRSDVSVHISGIVKNPDPVANEEVSSPALRIYTAEGVLCLDVPTATEAWLITVDGRLLRSLTLSPGLNRVYGLRQGVYIVRLKDGTARKVLIGK